MCQNECDELNDLNRLMVAREDEGDRKFFEDVLDKHLVFRRANDKMDRKQDFLNGLTPSPGSRSVVGNVESCIIRDTALVRLIVRMAGAGDFINRRVFAKRPQGWKCVAWFNEKQP